MAKSVRATYPIEALLSHRRLSIFISIQTIILKRTRSNRVKHNTSKDGVRALRPDEELIVAQHYGITLDEIAERQKRPCPPEAIEFATKLLPIATEAAARSSVLKRRGIISDHTHSLIRRLVGDVGIFQGRGSFASTFTTITVDGDEEAILAGIGEGAHSRRRSQSLWNELREDLDNLEEGGNKLVEMIGKGANNALLETPYLSIAYYVVGLAQSARRSGGFMSIAPNKRKKQQRKDYNG
jgi:hypothetical protein